MSEHGKKPAQRLKEWLPGRFSVRSFATRCGVAPSYITELYTRDRKPSAELRAAIEKETDGYIKASDWLEREEAPAKAPASERRPLSSMTPEERLEQAIQEARDELEDVTSDGARAALRATIIRAEGQLAILRIKAPIEQHPQYAVLVKALADAVERVCGAESLDALADELDALAAKLPAERRAA